MMLTTIPFSGFYESLWSSEIDSQEEQFAEYEETYRQTEEGVPNQSQLTASEICEILYWVTSYPTAYLQIAQWYADAYDSWLCSQIGEEAGLRFESMSSPREYNFETDRIFCHIPEPTVKQMYDLSKSEKHASLIALLKERFTSCDGFISGYSNDINKWVAKPLPQWDHNEVGTLILAMCGTPETEDIYYETMGDEGGYQAWSDAVDWDAYDEKVSELRAEKVKDLVA